MQRLTLLPWLIAGSIAGCGPGPGPGPGPPPPVPPRTADIARGRALAERWCAECHRVAPSQTRVRYPGNKAPPFAAIAARREADAAYFARFMEVQHLPMPIYRLDDAEKSDLAAYLVSLKPAR